MLPSLQVRQEPEVDRRHLLAFRPRQIHRLLNRAQRRAPADDQQIPGRITVNLWWLHGRGQRRQLAAAHVHTFLIRSRVVRDFTITVVRKAGEDVLAAAHARDGPF